MTTQPPNTINERFLVLLLSAVQLINVMEFMMISPLGPDFAAALSIPTPYLGYVTGSYTASSAIAGLLCTAFIDRFDRKTALLTAVSGLIIATLAAGLAQGLGSMLAARIAAGLCGGPTNALAFAIVADVIPYQRRGKAMSALMATFAIANIFAIPAGLEIAHLYGWRVPFFVISGLGVLVVLAASAMLPPLRQHLDTPSHLNVGIGELLSRPSVRMGLATTSSIMIGAFMLIPHLPAYAQYNLHLPREQFGSLFLYGGIASFITMHAVGRLVDRYGPLPLSIAGTILFLLTGYFTVIDPVSTHPAHLLYIGFMMATSTRNVAFQTSMSRIPKNHERARYLSLQSAFQHGATAIGAMASAQILTTDAGNQLIGIDIVTLIAMAFSAVLPFLMLRVDRLLHQANT